MTATTTGTGNDASARTARAPGVSRLSQKLTLTNRLWGQFAGAEDTPGSCEDHGKDIGSGGYLSADALQAKRIGRNKFTITLELNKLDAPTAASGY